MATIVKTYEMPKSLQRHRCWAQVLLNGAPFKWVTELTYKFSLKEESPEESPEETGSGAPSPAIYAPLRSCEEYHASGTITVPLSEREAFLDAVAGTPGGSFMDCPFRLDREMLDDREDTLMGKDTLHGCRVVGMEEHLSDGLWMTTFSLYVQLVVPYGWQERYDWVRELLQHPHVATLTAA